VLSTPTSSATSAATSKLHDDRGRDRHRRGARIGAACAARLVNDVDVLILADRDAPAIEVAAESLSAGQSGTNVVPFALDVTDEDGLGQLASRVADFGIMRALVHAAGISPTMADWRDIVYVDLLGSARLLEALRPAVTTGTAVVCIASMAPLLLPAHAGPAIDAALDDPMNPNAIELLSAALGPAVADPGIAYAWAKRGVQRLVQREAVAFGRRGRSGGGVSALGCGEFCQRNRCPRRRWCGGRDPPRRCPHSRKLARAQMAIGRSPARPELCQL